MPLPLLRARVNRLGLLLVALLLGATSWSSAEAHARDAGFDGCALAREHAVVAAASTPGSALVQFRSAARQPAGADQRHGFCPPRVRDHVRVQRASTEPVMQTGLGAEVRDDTQGYFATAPPATLTQAP